MGAGACCACGKVKDAWNLAEGVRRIRDASAGAEIIRVPVCYRCSGKPGWALEIASRLDVHCESLVLNVGPAASNIFIPR